MQYFGTWVNFCLFIISCKEDYNAKVMFSLFPSPSGRNQIFNNGKHQKNYSRVCYSWYFAWGSGSKEIPDLMQKVSPKFNLPSIYL